MGLIAFLSSGDSYADALKLFNRDEADDDSLIQTDIDKADDKTKKAKKAKSVAKKAAKKEA